jgi:GNAT superfamily N-acetyltransferase
MTMAKEKAILYEVLPASAERWGDVETLFGSNGASAGCWCMFWRLDRADYKKLQGEGNKAVLRDMVTRNEVPGILAYDSGKAVGWCSIGPREGYTALENSQTLKRIDDQQVWSVVCFYVARSHRRRQVMAALLHGAVAYARQHGARIIEGYPIDLQSPKLQGKKLTGCGGYMGIASAFRDEGFVEVAHASETQLIMRYYVK